MMWSTAGNAEESANSCSDLIKFFPVLILILNCHNICMVSEAEGGNNISKYHLPIFICFGVGGISIILEEDEKDKE